LFNVMSNIFEPRILDVVVLFTEYGSFIISNTTLVIAVGFRTTLKPIFISICLTYKTTRINTISTTSNVKRKRKIRDDIRSFIIF
jgi:hypothetical protein